MNIHTRRGYKILTCLTATNNLILIGTKLVIKQSGRCCCFDFVKSQSKARTTAIWLLLIPKCTANGKAVIICPIENLFKFKEIRSLEAKNHPAGTGQNLQCPLSKGEFAEFICPTSVRPDR